MRIYVPRPLLPLGTALLSWWVGILKGNKEQETRGKHKSVCPTNSKGFPQQHSWWQTRLVFVGSSSVPPKSKPVLRLTEGWMVASVVPESWVGAGFWEKLGYMRVERIKDSKKLTAIKCFPPNYETFKVIYNLAILLLLFMREASVCKKTCVSWTRREESAVLNPGTITGWVPMHWGKQRRLLQELHHALHKSVPSGVVTWCVFSQGWQQQSKHLLSLHLGWDST